ncbi:MAG TPA: FecR domain-containing protein, partial [Caulobacteraceae bacterium]|nr:FecR domain-containing protein [Caulobacteraceae bacterium]
ADRTITTGSGQMTTMTLPDGSVVTLDADTQLRVRDLPGQRLVTMDRGRAFFRVAKGGAQPFSLIAGGKKVTAMGTAFDVNLADDCFALVLVEGKVKVADVAAFRRPQTAELAAGSQLMVATEGRWAVTRVNVEKETGWLRGWMTYDSAPMGRIAEDLNRYSDKKIVIADANVAATPMMGAFKPGDVDGFVRAARYYRFAKVQSETADEVVLASPE